MNDSDDDRDPLDRLGEEFLGRHRRGEQPSISEFARRVPGQEADAREMLSALLMVEGLKPRFDETVSPSRRGIGLVTGLERLGDYRILREVGRGGMGVVYEAEQVSLGRRVALKILAPGVARSPDQIQRFRREARAAASLHHTNIVPVFGVGDQDGLYYYAMQFIVGQGLDKVLQEVKRHRQTASGGRRLTDISTPHAVSSASLTAVTQFLLSGTTEFPRFADEPAAPSSATPVSLPGDVALAGASDSERLYAKSVARVGVQVAEALEHAHQQGTLHRDIKPSNLLLDLKGNVWVADFGLAKAAADDDLTQTGDIVGTLRYMAPERFRGSCDARSDIHALGLTLYELLALRPAFDASNRNQLIFQMTQKKPPRLRSLNPAIPRDLETIIHKAIETEPSHRYPTAGKMADDLRLFLENRPIEAHRVPFTERAARWAKRNPGLATLGAAVGALLALIVALGIAADVRLREQNRLVLASLERAECAEADANAKLMESSLAHARASRRSGLAGRRLDALRALAQAARLDTAKTRDADLRNEAIACLALADLKAIRFADDPPDVSLDFDPTSRRTARGTASGEVVIDEDGRIVARLVANGIRAVIVRFSNDGRYLAVKHDGNDRTELVVHDLKTQKAVLRIADGVYAAALDFHPLSTSVAAGRRNGSIVVYDLESGREIAHLFPSTVPRAIRFDPSGERLAIASPNSDTAVEVRRVDDGRVVAQWKSPEGAMVVDWHPDGQSLAAAGEDGRIHLLDTASPDRAPRLLEGHGGSTVELIHHPGGRLLASASWDGTMRIWDTLTCEEVVKGYVHDVRRLRFSRDGTIFGPVQDGSRSFLWQLIEGREYEPLFSSDGPSLPIRSVEPLGTTGYLIAGLNAGLRMSTGDAASETAAAMPGTTVASAARDGSFFVTGGASGLMRWPVSAASSDVVRVGPPEPIGPRKGQPSWRIRLSRDGRTLAAVIDNERGRVLVMDMKGERAPVELAEHPNIERIDVSPDGLWVATGTWKGRGVRVWDARRGTCVADLAVDDSADVVFSPDGRHLLTGTGTEYRLWNVGTWTPGLRFAREGASDLPGEAAFRDDGEVLAIAWTRSLVKLVDPRTGKELATLEPPDPRYITGLSFEADGNLLVLASGTDAVRRWDLRTLREGLAELGLDWDATQSQAIAVEPSSPPPKIQVEPARWLIPFERGDAHLRSGRWAEAATCYQEAIAFGAPGVEPWSRLALTSVANNDAEGYRKACDHLSSAFGSTNPAPRLANQIAWSCALAPSAVADYAQAVALAKQAAASGDELNRLNTLGAILYRAGRDREALVPLERVIATHGSGGTPYDALFLALAHHRLGHVAEARDWLKHAFEPAPIGMRKPDESGPSSWMPRIELEILRREASRIISPPAE